MSRPVLFVASAEQARELSSSLKNPGIVVSVAEGVASARATLATNSFDAVFIAYRLGQVDAEPFIRECLRDLPQVPIVLLATEAQVPAAQKLCATGVHDYLRIPCSQQEATLVLQKALLASDHAERLGPSGAQHDSANLDSESPAMREAVAMADRAAQGSSTVLLRGESGVGKDVLARRIHERSARAAQPLVKVHCAALPEQILESELFGYEKGAFSGAVAKKPGRFELAEGGTLFLDEIGDIQPAVQVKLLRVLQDRQYERLGGTRTLRADVRIIAATHRNLERMVKSREFREDLYYRLNVVTITVPPLRARPDHIERLARHFAELFGQANRRQVSFSGGALAALTRAPWPGNVRQLQNLVERLVVVVDAPQIDEEHVERELERDNFRGDELSAELSVLELSAVVQKAERKALRRALDKAEGNRALAARLLGISLRTLFYKLKQYEMD
ncbi:MAG: sigma-54 dependent transcriptional regulator [Polyangiaceae bacterium]